ncbi:cytochrome P450, family 71 subfamily B, polypeptide 7 [Hibiscus trionum]|uniref:Cytochrome P450, family 71 subfamily B, polypeptide 7 n=1 Tax=Hibiscus trionum TaxID=183268 RepID=A0A9W7HM07_HIBTR|nr:cytochrome P450, family 71 subfamily B, polypeptide 7 [Hibiscus trionum]
MSEMELQSAAILSGNPLFLSLILLSTLVIWLKLAKRSNLKLPPSPPKLPIIGNIHQLGKLPHRSLRDFSTKYGPILLLHMGYNPTLVVSSADVVREIVKNHDIVFSNRPITTAVDILFYGCRDMVFAPNGEYWRQVRKMSAVELFSHRREPTYQSVRDKEVELLIDRIRGAGLKQEPVNLTAMLMFVMSNIVSRCVLSHKSEEEEDGVSKFGQMARKLVMIFGSFCFGDLFPYLRWLDFLTGYIRSLKGLSSEYDAFFDEVIQEHKALENGEEVSCKKDFVSIIMQLQKDGMFEDLTQDNIKAILLDMFSGGTDTTTTTSEWMMAELLKHPNAMKKVQQEVRNVVGNKSKVEPEDVLKMEYLRCVVKETLRLHPPVVLLPRKTSATVKLGGYDIPSDTAILINTWAIQRDPEWWEEPDEFIPERFEKSSIDLQGQDFHYIPFGFGRRGCPGMSFGVSSVEYVTANLLYWFDWELPAGETAENLDMDEHNGLAVTKKNPLHVIPISHLSS